MSDELTVATKFDTFDAQIYDVLGHLVLSQSFDNQEFVTLNLNNLQRGVYFIKIGNVSKRFIKE
ncbi:MAG: T9SS type A sorting domain-containing protein [Saprospiraceae bacterium]|nr:T9SS type A sorting domain-containing protein [Saprospiraceae bacterium]